MLGMNLGIPLKEAIVDGLPWSFLNSVLRASTILGKEKEKEKREMQGARRGAGGGGAGWVGEVYAPVVVDLPFFEHDFGQRGANSVKG